MLVLDPFRSSKWHAQYISAEPETYLKVVKASRCCACFVDECGKWADDGFDTVLKWMATNARHFGHNCHFITQRATQISPTIRTQCSNIFLFKQNFYDAREVARDFAADELLEAHKLKHGQYLVKAGVDGLVRKGEVFHA